MVGRRRCWRLAGYEAIVALLLENGADLDVKI